MSNQPQTRSIRRLIAAILAVSVFSSACGKPTALGEANSLIVVGPEEVWQQVEEATYAALEPTVFTTREEKMFNVTFVPTGGDELPQLLLWRQVIVFGTPDDARVSRVAKAAGDSAPKPGAIVQARDVWALNQVATAVVLEPGREAETWREALPSLEERLESGFREYARAKMFVSGVDTVAAREIRERYGFTIEVPRVYQVVEREGEIVIFRNDNPDPSELIRSVLIQRTDPVDSVAPEDVYAWRETIDEEQYNVPQDFDRLPQYERSLSVGGRPAVEVRGIWKDRGTFPAAGPFIARGVSCLTATFFIDAWLYSPNPRRSKWEYLMQLETIIDSFRCVD